MLKKYVDNGDDNGHHFMYCQKNRIPFISLTQKHRDYVEIFYDITDFRVNLSDISNQLKDILCAYYQFNLIPYYDYQHYIELPYFFSFIVKKEHKECMATLLFDFLMAKIHQ